MNYYTIQKVLMGKQNTLFVNYGLSSQIQYGIQLVFSRLVVQQQAFSFLIPLQDEFKVCLDENGWYIYNLEGQTYSSNALEKLLSTVELRKKI